MLVIILCSLLGSFVGDSSHQEPNPHPQKESADDSGFNSESPSFLAGDVDLVTSTPAEPSTPGETDWVRSLVSEAFDYE